MSIRYGLLALLKSGPKYGYQLRGEFEDATGGTWPLNVGQVYTTLGRLERDGLVEPAGTDEDGRVRYRLTPAGDADVTGWLRTPVDRSSPPRNELAIKLALALTVPGADIRHLVQTQRTATLRTLQEYTRLKRDNADADLPWSLVLDSLIFGAEAEVRWLDHCEARLARAASEGVRSSGPAEHAEDETSLDAALETTERPGRP